MALFNKTTVKLLGRALSAYLPSARTEVVQITSPRTLPALRVWFAEHTARDYFTANGEWHEIQALMRFSVEPHRLHVSAGTGVQLISATIAAELAGWHRRRTFPLASDLFPPGVTKAEFDESVVTLRSCLDFLTALSMGRLPFTDKADQLARTLLARLETEMQAALAEAEAATAEEKGEKGPAEELRRAVAETFPLLATEVVFLDEEKLWALSFVNVDGETNWVAHDGTGWFDSENMFWDEENDSGVDYSIREMVLEVAWLLLYKIADEFKTPEPIQHEELFGQVVEWMIAVRDESKTEAISKHAGFYLSMGVFQINENKHRFGS